MSRSLIALVAAAGLLGFIALMILQTATCVYVSLPGGLYRAVCAHVGLY